VDANRPFQFEEGSRLFLGVHNEPLPIAAMRVRNPDCSPVGINRWDAAPIPTGFAEIVSDYFPRFPVLSFVAAKVQ
jgi:hypothetical protein